MLRIRILEGVGYNGDSLEVGREYEVDEKYGRIFIQLGKACRVDTPTPAGVVETREPESRHRDPVVRRGARGR